MKTRVAFGKTLAEKDTILADIAHSRMELDQARLLTLKAAHMMDTVGNKVRTCVHAWLTFNRTQSYCEITIHKAVPAQYMLLRAKRA